MKILSAEDIKLWDQFTIQNEPVTSINLMERAASKCVEWLEKQEYSGKHFSIYCGMGNNGGDGLAIARLLAERKFSVSVYVLETGNKGTDDFRTNLQRLQSYKAVVIEHISSEKDFAKTNSGEIIIDALLGSGLNRPLEGLTSKLVSHINHSDCEIISIDIPSGLYVDRSSKANTVIHAKHTLSFQCFKMAFLFPENATAIGKVHILDIGLHPRFYENVFSRYQLIEATLIKNIYQPRDLFAHKGTFGHAAIVAGSTGMMGAATLCAKASLRSGAGKLTCYVPKTGYEIMQTSVPEAMSRISGTKDYIEWADGISEFDSVAIGPGIGINEYTTGLLKSVLQQTKKPVVIDADALNILASNHSLFQDIPPYSILTPHKKEFERLFGKSENACLPDRQDFDEVKLAEQKAKELNVVIILKGHYSFIATPQEGGYFNSTGNAGMATGGSGDVLTGILAGLLAQKYSSVEAAILGVYLHGVAGDLAAEKFSEEAMVAGDIVDYLGNAFKKISGE